MNGIQSSADWLARCPVGEAWEPIREPIGPGTAFLYSETTAPLPSAAMYGFWQWFTDERELAGYLRIVGLPGMLSTWFCQQEWDPDHDRVPMGSRQILAGAREHGYLTEDIPFVEGLLDRMEAVDGVPKDQVLGVLGEVTSAFTARFGRTSSWDLVLQIHASAVAAGAAIAQRLDWETDFGPDELPEPFHLEQWLGVCRRADAGDAEAAALVAEVLANNDTL